MIGTFKWCFYLQRVLNISCPSPVMLHTLLPRHPAGGQDRRRRRGISGKDVCWVLGRSLSRIQFGRVHPLILWLFEHQMMKYHQACFQSINFFCFFISSSDLIFEYSFSSKPILVTPSFSRPSFWTQPSDSYKQHL